MARAQVTGLIQQHTLIAGGSAQGMEAKHGSSRGCPEEMHLGVDSGAAVFLFPVATQMVPAFLGYCEISFDDNKSQVLGLALPHSRFSINA